MSLYYRVGIYSEQAQTPEDNGHPLFRWPRQGFGRIDDPLKDYLVLYLADTAEAAVAEVFGRFPEWRSALFDVPPAAPPNSRRALFTYQGEPRVCDLDDGHRLVEYGLRPSRVVTRDRTVTQEWARAIYERRTPEGEQEFAGLSWWSYYNPDWSSLGLWDVDLTVEDVEDLSLESLIVQETAFEIARVIEEKTRRRPAV
ncbi:MAG TPA: RES domain-containing protein [Actinocrinis sp.]|nr:RES domain-containing protein [Actinocrinis sp.]